MTNSGKCQIIHFAKRHDKCGIKNVMKIIKLKHQSLEMYAIEAQKKLRNKFTQTRTHGKKKEIMKRKKKHAQLFGTFHCERLA